MIQNTVETSIQPLVSIIIPVHNVEKYLLKCLKSIQLQTYSTFEVILVDDGSTDHSGDICDDFVKKDTRFACYHRLNEGVAAARNFGLENASGELIMFVDSDDWVSPNIISVLEKVLREQKADIVACESYYVRGEKKNNPNLTGMVTNLNRIDALNLLISDRVFRSRLWGRLYKAKVWENISFPVGKTYEDVSTLYKTYLQANKFSFVHQALYYYNQRDGSIVHPNDYKSLFPLLEARESRFQGLSQNYPELTDNLKGSVISAALDILRKAAKSNTFPQEDELSQINTVISNVTSKRASKQLAPSYRAEFFLYRRSPRLFRLLTPWIDKAIARIKKRVN